MELTADHVIVGERGRVMSFINWLVSRFLTDEIASERERRQEIQELKVEIEDLRDELDDLSRQKDGRPH